MRQCKSEEERMVHKNFYFTKQTMDMIRYLVELGLTPNISEYIRHAVLNQLAVDSSFLAKEMSKREMEKGKL